MNCQRSGAVSFKSEVEQRKRKVKMTSISKAMWEERNKEEENQSSCRFCVDGSVLLFSKTGAFGFKQWITALCFFSFFVFPIESDLLVLPL